MADHDTSEGAAASEEARWQKAEADRAALERLYGPAKKDASAQSWVGVALLVLGVVLIAAGGTMGDELVLVAVGIVALGVGVWAIFEGLARRRRAG